MRRDRLLPRRLDRLVLHGQVEAARGGAVAEAPGGGGFAGGTAGVNAVIETDLDTGYTVIVLSNLDPPSAESVAKRLRGWLGLR